MGEVLAAVTETFTGPVLTRLSVSAYHESGNSLADYQEFATWLESQGVAALDISTGGLLPIMPSFEI